MTIGVVRVVKTVLAPWAAGPDSRSNNGWIICGLDNFPCKGSDLFRMMMKMSL